MNYFHAGYHLLAMILQYLWGVLAAFGVYVLLPGIAIAAIISITGSLLPRKKGETDGQF